MHTASRINALSLNEIFALYERAGFLYPEKAARLLPHLKQVRDNWRRMLRAGDSLLYVLTAGDKKNGPCLHCSFGARRITAGPRNTWFPRTNPMASRAVMLAEQPPVF